MRVLLKIPELWVHTASHTEDDLHQFDQTIIFCGLIGLLR